MTVKIAIICAVAILSYVIVPAASQALLRRKRAKTARKLAAAQKKCARCSDFRDGFIHAVPSVGSAKPVGDATGDFVVNPAKTRLYAVEASGSLEPISWKSVSIVKVGAPIAVFDKPGRFSKGICLFHEERSEEDLVARLEAIAQSTVPHRPIPDPVKYAAIGVGAFVEFMIFISSLGEPDMNLESIAALVAIFAKALPYCPPGLLLTLVAQLAIAPRGGEKKSRKRRAFGFATETLGVLLNVAVLFLAFQLVGFVVF